MNIKKIIDQIGGRERLAKLLSQYEEDGYCDVKDDEVIAAVIGLLALLDAQQKPFMYAISDCDGKAQFDECCVSAHGCDLEDVVGSLNDFREVVDDGYSIVPVYTVPPAASVPDVTFDPAKPGSEAKVITHYPTPAGWKLVPVVALPSQWAAGHKASGAAVINKIDHIYRAMVEAAPDHKV